MNTTEALLAAILANPDEDLVRLVYADFIEEQGDPARGELIRLQCELARQPVWSRLAAELRHRERTLLVLHGRRWLAELPKLEGMKWGKFQRGFVSEISVPNCKVLQEVAEEAGTMAPLVGVRLNELPTSDLKARPIPWLRRLNLTNREEFRAEDFQRLLGSALGENLEQLGLSEIGVENLGAEAIARSTNLKRLKKIDFSNCFVGVAGVQALAEAKHLRGVTSLNFNCAGSGYVEDPFVAEAGVELLCESPTFAHLTELGLGGNGLTGPSLRRILASKILANVEWFDCGWSNTLTGEDFTSSNSLSRWKSFNLQTYVDPRTRGSEQSRLFEKMVECPQLAQVEQLKLSGFPVSAAGMAALAKSSMAQTLRELHLTAVGIGADELAPLTEGHWPHLHKLNLQNNPVEQVGAIYLSECTGLPELRSLELSYTKMTQKGAIRLLSAPWMANLRELHLASADLKDGFAKELVKCPNLQHLVMLNLSENSFTSSSLSSLGNSSLQELTDLSLGNVSNCGDAVIISLVFGKKVESLISLTLNNSDLTADGLEQLAQASPPQLAHLGLSGNSIGDRGALALASAPWPSLRSLQVSSCNIKVSGMTALATAPFFDQLRAFHYWGNTLPTRGPAAQKFQNTYFQFQEDPTWIELDPNSQYDD